MNIVYVISLRHRPYDYLHSFTFIEWLVGASEMIRIYKTSTLSPWNPKNKYNLQERNPRICKGNSEVGKCYSIDTVS